MTLRYRLRKFLNEGAGLTPALMIGTILVLAATLLYGCGEVSSESSAGYKVINTGIKGGGCWYDDTHFIVVQGQQPPGQEFEVQGLYVLDPAKPKELKRIDLSPIELTLQKQIRDVSCQDQTILFYVMNPDRQASRLYGLKLGQAPEVIAQMHFATPRMISLKGGYLFNFSPALRTRGAASSQSDAEARKDCSVSMLKAGLKVVCWANMSISQFWVLPQFVVTEYLWRETIKSKSADGQEHWIPNPEPPLKLADGREIKQGYFLRDLENRIVLEIVTGQPPYQIYRDTFRPDPDGQYLYAACSKSGDHGTRHLTVGGRVCRFKLDGSNREWAEVFSVQQTPQDPFSLHELHVNSRGDVAALDLGHRRVASLWRYTAIDRRVDKVVEVPTMQDLAFPQLSADGRWVSFIQQRTLFLAQARRSEL